MAGDTIRTWVLTPIERSVLRGQLATQRGPNGPVPVAVVLAAEHRGGRAHAAGKAGRTGYRGRDVTYRRT